MTTTTNTALTFHIVGDAYVDLFCFLEGDLPESGGDSRLEEPIRQYAGGSSTNTATHLHALLRNFVVVDTKDQDQNLHPEKEEVVVVVLHTVFNETDLFGKLLIQHGAKHGFEIINCYRPDRNAIPLSTGHCVAIVFKGERSFMTHQGCVGAFSSDHLDLPRIITTPHDIHVHIAGYFNVEGFHHGNLRRALEQIRTERSLDHNFSTTISLVTQHDASKQWDGGLQQVTPYLDFLIMNELEANSILKRAGVLANNSHGKFSETTTTTTTPSSQGDVLGQEDNSSHIEKWIHYFSSWDPTTCVIITLGAKGAVAFRNHELMATLLPAIRVEVVDPTGAGDSFTAGFLHGMWDWKRRQQEQQQPPGPFPIITDYSPNVHQGFPKTFWPAPAIQQALDWGCAVGTSAVTIRGASNPASAETIQSYYQEQHFRKNQYNSNGI